MSERVILLQFYLYCSDCCLSFLLSRLIPYHYIKCLTRKEGNMLIDVKQMNFILEMVAASRKLIENTVWLVSSHLSSGNYRVLYSAETDSNIIWEHASRGFSGCYHLLCLSLALHASYGMRHCAPSILCRPNSEFISESGFSSHLCIIRSLPCQSGSFLNFVC